MADTALLTCLRSMVASAHEAAVQARECHWNVTGSDFGPLHKLFGQAYEEWSDFEDTIAERVRALGGKVPASLERFRTESKLTVKPLFNAAPLDMMKAVLGTYTTMADCIRAALDEYEEKDCITANILQDIGAKVEKRAWMLRMHLV